MTPVEQYQHDLMALAARRKSELATKICSGTIPSFEEYKAMCGRLDGMAWFTEMSKDLLKNRENLIDDEGEGDGLSEMPTEPPVIGSVKL